MMADKELNFFITMSVIFIGATLLLCILSCRKSKSTTSFPCPNICFCPDLNCGNCPCPDCNGDCNF